MHVDPVFFFYLRIPAIVNADSGQALCLWKESRELCEIFFVSLGLNFGVERLEFDPNLSGDNLLLPYYDWRTILSSHDACFDLQAMRNCLVVIERTPARPPIPFITTIPHLRRDRCADRLSHLF